ncbi:MAG: sugar phosphate isomerase/epimerase [Clostridia bacterium]|nr:sugar phosphate isomerase/epimerase [Clostridia bacterium]
MKFGTLYAYWTHDWTGDYKHFARKASEIGFDILEISAGDLIAMPEKELCELKAISKELGIEITSNIGPAKKYDVASPDKNVREAGIKFLSDIMEKMDKLDSRSLVGVMYTYWPNDFTDLDKEGAWARGVESVKRLGKVAGELGIDYCLEVVNRFETHILNTAEEGVRYCKDVDCPSVKLLLDTFHMNIEEDNLADAIRLAGPYLAHLHVGEGNRKLPGTGHLPWRDIGKALNDIGYNKGVVMEPFVTMGGKVGEDIKVWRDLSGNATPEKMDEDIKKSLMFLRDAFAR